MYADESTGCCGVVELLQLDYLTSKEALNEILAGRFDKGESYYDSYAGRMYNEGATSGMALAFFVKHKGTKKIEGHKNRTMMLRNGFKKMDSFWNPNTGNWIYPVYITRKEWLKRQKKGKKK